MAKEKVIILKVENEQAVESISEVGAEINDAKKESNELSASVMDNIKNFKIFGVSINSVTKGLKLLRVSLIATGIGAIAVAVGTLASAFFSTQKGADTLTKILTPLSEVLGTIWGIVQQLGEGLFDMVSGDISGGFDKMAGAVDNFGDKMEEAYERGRLMADLMIEIAELNSVESLTLSRLARQRSEYRAILEDDTASLEARKQALVNLEAVDNAISDVRINRLKKELELKEADLLKNDSDLKAKEERNDILQQIEEAEKERFDKAKVRSLALRRLVAGGKDSDDPADLRSPVTGLSANEMKAAHDLQTTIIDDMTNYVIADYEKRKKGQEQAAAVAKKIADEEFSAKMKMQTAISQAAAATSDLIGRQTVEGKALAVASSLIATYTAIAATLAQASKTPAGGIPGYAIAQSIAVGIAGFAAVKNIISTKVPGGYGGNASIPGSVSSGASGAAGQPPSFNIVGEGGTNQVVDAINDRNTQPVRAYVVGADVSTQQGLDRNTIENATVI